MRFSSIFALALSIPIALAQDNSTTSNYAAGLLDALRGHGLTYLAEVIGPLLNTTEGQMAVGQLVNQDVTFFAPDNRAVHIAEIQLGEVNDAVLGALLQYHVASGAFPDANSFATTPNHTIMRTFLNESSLVQLEANKSQVLVTEKSTNNTVTILRQFGNVTVSNTTTYQRVTIHAIDAVLFPPLDLFKTAPQYHCGDAVHYLQESSLGRGVSRARGLTVFAPSDRALRDAMDQLGPVANNETLFTYMLGNHIVNGTTAYSTQLGSGTYTSASGQPFQFMTNSTGTFVMSGNSTAQIIVADVPVMNGVLHVIDGVLANTGSNPGAASSAFQAATSSAAQATTAPGPVGASTTSTGSSSSSSTSSSSGGAMVIPEISLVFYALAVVSGAFFSR